MLTNKEILKKSLVKKLHTLRGKCLQEASSRDIYFALVGVARDYIYENWMKTNRQYNETKVKQVYYFSMEFLLGKLTEANLLNLKVKNICREACEDLGINYEEVEKVEPEAGLGNGGLGRLAACFLDSLASLSLPGHGYGIRYKYGHFSQKVVDGYQVELPDNWLKEENAWEVRNPDRAVEVKFGGEVTPQNKNGKLVFNHENYYTVLAVPYDIPVIGYDNNTVNTLRLWNAEVEVQDYDFASYNHDQYLKIMEYKYSAEEISQVLYPDDSSERGKILRLKQEYFLVSAGLQSILNSYKKRGVISDLHNKVAIHINDTHPTLAVPELMRILMDEEGLGWNEAWDITVNTISYTNHTLMAEALEKWPKEILKNLLPRIYMIIEEINERFCSYLWDKYPGQWELIRELAIIADGNIKMANLAIVGSYSINGVSKLHTEILKYSELNKFYNLYPYKFNSKTNGITHRRWLYKSNPDLTKLLGETIGNSFKENILNLQEINNYKDDPSFREKILQVKRQNKEKLAKLIKEQQGIDVDLDSIFDVQIKRIHAYKRQLLNVLHIMDLYNRLLENPDEDIYPRTFIFGGKAAPGYYFAKMVIKLINTLADKINNDDRIKDKIKVVFLENYRVSLAETIIPAADISEQISTASKEASGTGNMKLMMNGAVTLGTLDGANIEIRNLVGNENIFIFGLTSREVLSYYNHGGYNSQEVYNSDKRIKRALDNLVNGFLPVNEHEFRFIYDSLIYENDEFFVLKDFASYADAQTRVERDFKNREKWAKMSIANIARSGEFSSDRTIMNYATEIWEIEQSKIY